MVVCEGRRSATKDINGKPANLERVKRDKDHAEARRGEGRKRGLERARQLGQEGVGRKEREDAGVCGCVAESGYIDVV